MTRSVLYNMFARSHELRSRGAARNRERQAALERMRNTDAAGGWCLMHVCCYVGECVCVLVCWRQNYQPGNRTTAAYVRKCVRTACVPLCI